MDSRAAFPFSRSGVRTNASITRADRSIFNFFAVQVCIVVFLQRIVVPGIGINVALPFMGVGLFLLACREGLRLSPIRVVLYSITVALALVSQVLPGKVFSVASVALFLVCYLPLLVKIPVQPATYIRCLLFFQNVMLLVCGIVVIQDVWQFTIGWQSFPDMDQLLPDWLIAQGFVYIQPLYYGAAYIKPSAFFFKEVSFCSQYLAIAFIVEVAFFQRYWRLMAYLGCIFATFAGTGLLLLVVTAPFLAAKLPARPLIVLGVITLVVTAIAMGSGWFDQVSGRLTEYQDQNSSTSGRFILPFLSVFSFAPNLTLFSGLGAGQIPTEQLFVFIPLSKLVLEYGPAVTVAFYAMLVYALLDGGSRLPLAVGLFMLYNLMGGYFQDPNIINTLVLLGTLLRPTAVGSGGGVESIRLAAPSARHGLA